MSERLTVVITGQDAGASATAEKVGKSFRGVGTEAERMNRALDAIERNTAETARALDAMSREALEADRALAKAESTGQKFSRTGAALGATVSAVTGFLSEAARAAAESEASQARLEAAVNATGESFDEYAAQLDAAGQAALDMAFDDEEAADALATLTTQTGSAQEALDLLGLAMDLARGRGISLAEASTIVGKVAEGNTAILTRYGIAVEAGATAQEALAAVQQRYAGQAVAYSESTAGAIDRLQNSFRNMLEAVGASTGGLQTFLALLPGISAGVTGVSAILGGLAGEAGIAALLASLAGPAGLVVAAGAAAFAIYSLTQEEERHTVTVLDATTATEGLTQAMLRLAQAGASFAGQRAAAERWDAELEALANVSGQYEDVTALEQAFMEAAEARAIAERQAGNMSVDTVAEINAARERARQVVEDYNLSLEDSTEINNLLAQALNYTGEAFDAVAAHVDEAFEDFQRGRIDADQLIERLKLIPEVALAATDGVRQLADAVNVLGDGIGVLHETLPGSADDLLNYTDSLALANQAQTDAAESGRALNDTLAQMADDELVTTQEGWTGLAGAIAYATSEADQAAATHQFLADAIGESTSASYAAGDAVDWYGSRLDALAGIESEASGTANDLQQAYDILNERIAAGIPLTEDQLALYNQLPGAIAEYEAQADEAVLAQAELIVGHGDAASAADDLNGTMVDLTDILRELVRVLGGEVPNAAQNAKSALADLLNLGGGGSPLSGLAGSIAAALGTPAAVPAIPSQPGDLSGGPAPTAPLAPPVGVLPVQAAPLVVEFEADYSSVVEAAAAVEGLLEEATGEPYTVELVGDGEDASAVIRDVEGEVVAVVDEDYVIYLTGDSGQAVNAIDAAMRELAAADGSSATVDVYANTSPAANAIAAQLGYQGDAWINVYANPIGGGFTNPNVAYAAGGVVEAASGRVVRAGELGPELVYPPGGAPYLAARDGLYVMAPGSFVSPAAATRAAPSGAGINLTVNVYGSVGVDDIAERLVDLLDQSLAMAFSDRYTAIGWPYGT